MKIRERMKLEMSRPLQNANGSYDYDHDGNGRYV
jgi:hypothetical protein